MQPGDDRDFREIFGRLHDLESARAGNGLPDPSGEPDGQWLRTASGAAVWVSATAADIPFVPVGTISATDVQAAIAEVAAEASGAVSSVFSRTGAVTAATSDYDAVQVDFTPTGTIAATNTQAAVEEVATEAASALAAHIGDTVDAHDGSAISFAPAGTISATDVQAAIEEVAAEAGGGVPTSRTLTAGSGLSGGGTLAADRTFDVNVDGSTVEINGDTLRVKADGITANEIAAGAVGAPELASTAVTPATYGTASKVGSFTVDADGRITAASEITIPGVGTGGTVKLYDYEVTGADKASIDTNVDGTTVANFAGYDVLEMWLYHRSDETAVISGTDLVFNNDTSSIYDTERLRALSAALTGNATSAFGSIFFLGAGASAAANAFTVTRFSIPNYLGTVGYKAVEIVGGLADPTGANKEVDIYQGLWRSTAAITRIMVRPNTAAKKFKIGTRLLVYGR